MQFGPICQNELHHLDTRSSGFIGPQWTSLVDPTRRRSDHHRSRWHGTTLVYRIQWTERIEYPTHPRKWTSIRGRHLRNRRKLGQSGTMALDSIQWRRLYRSAICRWTTCRGPGPVSHVGQLGLPCIRMERSLHFWWCFNPFPVHPLECLRGSNLYRTQQNWTTLRTSRRLYR